MSDNYTIPLKRAKVTGKILAKIAENQGFPINAILSLFTTFYTILFWNLIYKIKFLF